MDDLGAEWHAVEDAIDAKKEAGKNELAEEIRQKIADSGFDVTEIVALLSGRKRRTRSTVSYATYVDPDNAANTYVRGVLPGWMKDQMKAKGLDPSNKEDRETFKQKHLKVAN